MKHFTRHITSRNPVWIVPLALPFVLYGSTSLFAAILFPVLILTLVPIVHGISFFVERRLPRHLRIIPVLIVAAGVVTIMDMVLSALGVVLSQRADYLLRSLTVAGITIWPTIAAPRGETFRHRLSVAGGLAVGFAIGFIPLALVRIALSTVGYHHAESLFAGFLLIALGRIALNLFRRERSGETSQ